MASVKAQAESLCESLRAESAAASRVLAAEEAHVGCWSEEAASAHACREAMRTRVDLVKSKIEWYSEFVTQVELPQRA